MWLLVSALVAKVQRNDSLARLLNQHPSPNKPVQRHVIPLEMETRQNVIPAVEMGHNDMAEVETEQQRLEQRQQIGATLNRQADSCNIILI